MLSFPPAVSIWLALAPADLRKGFDALAELVRQHLRDDPLSVGPRRARPSQSRNRGILGKSSLSAGLLGSPSQSSSTVA